MADFRQKFDWLVYADATFAGLSVLLPIPLLDLAFEWLFRRRMPGMIAKRNGRSLSKNVTRQLNRSPLHCSGCLLWPVLLILELLKRTYRTIFYFLTVKAATDQLSFYWHRAFLIDYLCMNDYLHGDERAEVAILALNETLAAVETSPLLQLAQQVVTIPSHLFRTLRRVLRRGEEQVNDDNVTSTRNAMAAAWDSFGDYFQRLAFQFEERYQMLQQEMLPAPETQSGAESQLAAHLVATLGKEQAGEEE